MQNGKYKGIAEVHRSQEPENIHNSDQNMLMSSAIKKNCHLRCVDIRLLSQGQNTQENATFDASVLNFLPKSSSTPSSKKHSEKQRSTETPRAIDVHITTREAGTRATALTGNDDFEDSYLSTLMRLESRGRIPLCLPNRTTSATTIAAQPAVTEHEALESETTYPVVLQTEALQIISPTAAPQTAALLTAAPQTTASVKSLVTASQTAASVITPTAAPQTTASVKSLVTASQTATLVTAAPQTTASVKSLVTASQTAESQPIALTATSRLDQAGVGTDDDSDVDWISTIAPMDLAPAGANITRHFLFKCDQPEEGTTQSSTSNNLKAAKTVLNQPSRPAINGEEFAQELARMSYCEILDLRKRNSMGILCAKNGQNTIKISEREQFEVEQSIETELLKRKSCDNIQGLKKPNVSMFSNQSMAPPAAPAIRDRNSTTRKKNEQKGRNSRSRRHVIPMTEELKNYLSLSETIEKRLQSRSTNMSKRSLYTKGNSDVEDNLLKSPPHNCNKGLEIAGLRRSKRNQEENVQQEPSELLQEDINIVPPPPDYLRYSNVMSKSRRWNRIMSVDQEEEDQQEKFQQEEVQQGEVQHMETQQEEEQQRMLQEAINIVPPPPDSLSYSNIISKSRRWNRIMSVDQEEEDQQEKVQQEKVQQGKVQQEEVQREEDDIYVIPPPPDSLRYSNVMGKSRRIVEHMDDGQQEQIQQQKVQLEQVQTKVLQHKKEQKEKVKQKPHQATKIQKAKNSQAETDLSTQSADERSTYMEALRMETPTPPLPTTCDQNVLNEGPSTSKASRKALELSLKKQQNETQKRNKPDKEMQKRNKPDKEMQKRSTVQDASAAKSNRELSNLYISLPNATLPPDANEETQEQDTSTVRRSKRGQMPLRNTWSHTLVDPFAHMRRLYETKICPPKNQSAMNKTLKRKQTNSDDNTKTQETEILARPKKRVRIRNTATVETEIETEIESETEPKLDDPLPLTDESLDENDNDAMQLTDAEEAPPVAQPKSFQLISWLRGINKENPDPIDNNHVECESIVISSVNDLEFVKPDGIEYAFYSTEDAGSFGYMRFQPLHERGITSNRSNTLRFIVLHGQFKIECGLQRSDTLKQVIINAGDNVQIKPGSRYNITNLLDEVGVLLLSRESTKVDDN